MKIYCLNCGKELKSYKTISKKMDIVMKGNTYSYDGHEAVCPDCGEPLYVEEVLRYNKEQAWQAYRNANDIISQEDILAIPEKYNVSKRNISKYLGWGDVTFSRYCSGYIPTKHNSDVLKDILVHPEHLTEKIRQYLESHPDDKNAQRDLRKMTISNLYDAVINMEWDENTDVWTATSDDIPGLVMESSSFDELTNKVKKAIPELLKLNNMPDKVMIDFQSNRKELIGV